MSEPERAYPTWVVTASEQKLHDDFRAMVWLIWKHLKLPNPTPRQLAIARYIQSGPNRRMVQAWRGAAKTWIACAYCLWRLYRNPNERIKIVSANEKKAVENATFIRRLIEEIEQLQFLRPEPGMRDSVLAFDVGGSDAAVTPSVSCVGITGQLTGGRATILIPDDIEVPKNSLTETMRERLSELVKEFDAMIVPEGFDVVWLGTPQTEESVYKLLPERGVDIRVWPARYPFADKIASYCGRLAPDIVADLELDPKLAGRSVEPSRFSDIDLAQREMNGKSWFALQYMLDTALSDAERYPLRLSDLSVMDVAIDQGPVRVEWTSDPRNAMTELQNVGFTGDRFYRPLHISTDRTPWVATVMIVDPAGRGADETAYAILRSLNGVVYLVASGGFTDGFADATLKGLAELAKKYRVNQIEVESQFGDGMFTKLLEPHFTAIDPETKQPFYPCTITEYKVTGQKELRIIEDLEPVLNQHRLVVDRAVIEEDQKADPKYQLFYQLTHITKDRGSLRHDDRLEVLARGVRYFREQLGRDQVKAEEAHREKLRDQMYADFIKLAGGQPQQQTFMRGPSVLRGRR